jgi:hypothetical protein
MLTWGLVRSNFCLAIAFVVLCYVLFLQVAL